MSLKEDILNSLYIFIKINLKICPEKKCKCWLQKMRNIKNTSSVIVTSLGSLYPGVHGQIFIQKCIYWCKNRWLWCLNLHKTFSTRKVKVECTLYIVQHSRRDFWYVTAWELTTLYVHIMKLVQGLSLNQQTTTLLCTHSHLNIHSIQRFIQQFIARTTCCISIYVCTHR